MYILLFTTATINRICQCTRNAAVRRVVKIEKNTNQNGAYSHVIGKLDDKEASINIFSSLDVQLYLLVLVEQLFKVKTSKS